MAIDDLPLRGIPALVGIERDRLLEMLATLGPSDWEKPTPCPEWSVLALCSHLVGVDVSSLSRNRDHHHGSVPPMGASEAEFIGWIDNLQMEWVGSARRLSPRVVIDLLAWSGPQLVEMFEGEDPTVRTAHVSWAGSDPVPAWLNQVRELSEYWIHRQQLRQALDLPADLRPDLVGPILEGLRWAYPFRLGEVPAATGDTVVIAIHGPFAATWPLVATDIGWEFSDGPGARVVAELSMTTDQAWRLLSNNLSPDDRSQLGFSGDQRIQAVILRTRAIIGSPN
ncbi:MAG TPA: maleylpyruvate isomerase family mycothiol-dependent enzyme [Acidimicrobiales bacterium]|jgi:uncharacterized protein (TIGR03083 family)